MEERTDSNALPFGVQTMRILFIRFFPLIGRVKPADAVIILPSVLSQSIHQRKAQLHPIFLNEVVNNSISVDDRDTILIGAIVCLSVCFHNVCGVYDERIVYPNLYLFVVAEGREKE